MDDNIPPLLRDWEIPAGALCPTTIELPDTPVEWDPVPSYERTDPRALPWACPRPLQPRERNNPPGEPNPLTDPTLSEESPFNARGGDYEWNQLKQVDRDILGPYAVEAWELRRADVEACTRIPEWNGTQEHMEYFLAVHRGDSFHFGQLTDSDIIAHVYANHDRTPGFQPAEDTEHYSWPMKDSPPDPRMPGHYVGPKTSRLLAGAGNEGASQSRMEQDQPPLTIEERLQQAHNQIALL
ncbi:hypothetical protein ARMGADRAFT_1036601 [Armillaria gallica]|uniref:Uncharacterized protein n=1 Tax=Armillaria gallica TaxID=47427 RepID=A0A2H3CPZ0_ARMGA|nr:hypothetical protein ARMGADRAFT_1036601 [Armillaria gallica]